MVRVLFALLGLGAVWGISGPTVAPTQFPTSTPTVAPTAPLGKCCGTNATTNAPFCKATTEIECGASEAPEPRRFASLFNARRNLGGDSFEAGGLCTSSCAPLGGSSKNGGVVKISIDASHANFSSSQGVELGPLDFDGLPPLEGGEIIIAFSLTKFDGLEPQEGGPLGAGFYILVTIEYDDPAFKPDKAVVLYRLDESTGEWVDSATDCTGAHPDNAFTPPATWTVPICHLSDFGLSLADSDDKDDKKPSKKDKGKKAGKPSKDGKKPSKSVKDSKPKAGKDVKEGKDKKTKVAVGAGVGAGVAVMAAVGGVVAWRKRGAAKKAASSKTTARPTVRAGPAPTTVTI